MDIGQSNITLKLSQIKYGKYAIYLLEGIGIVVTIYEFQGVLLKGLRFLGRYTSSPRALRGGLIGISILICAACGSVLFYPKLFQNIRRKKDGKAFSKPTKIASSILLISNILATTIVFTQILRFDKAEASQPNSISILVANFGQGMNIEPSPLGKEISAYIKRSLRREIERSGYNITILDGPRITNADDAFRIGTRNGVNVVLWGWVSDTDTEYLIPNFTYIESECGKENAGELPILQSLELDAGSNIENSKLVSRRAINFIEYIIALLHIENGKPADALTALNSIVETTKIDLNQATEVDKENYRDALAYYLLAGGRAYSDLGEYEKASQMYAEAMQYSPNFWPIYLGLGNIEYTQSSCTDAHDYYAIAADLNPEEDSVWYALGNASYCLGEYSNAIRYYQQAIAQTIGCDDNESLYRMVLGAAYCRAGATTRGIDTLTEALTYINEEDSLNAAIIFEIQQCEDMRVSGPEAIPPELHQEPDISPTPTRTPTDPAPTNTATPTYSIVSTIKPSANPSPKDTLTPTSTLSPTLTATNTPYPTGTNTPGTPSLTPSQSPTDTPILATSTPTLTPTNTPIHTNTFTPTATYTPFPTPVVTP